MSDIYILRESVGCCLQDAGRMIFKTKSPQKRIKKLFLELLLEAEYDEEYIDEAKECIDEEDFFEDDDCYYDGCEAWVQFDDLYNTRTYLNIVRG